MAGDVLVIMARQPVAGAVKTRLAAHIGAAAAGAIYQAFLRDLALRFGAGAAWRLVWAVDPPGADLSPYLGVDAVQFGQRGAELGARMADGMARLLGDGAARVVMIGADVPHLPDAVLVEAFGALDAHDVVLVPTRDGGYCLIGLTAPHDLFTGIAMGRPDVLAETRARATALGLAVRVLEETFDVDELDDLRELARRIDAGSVDLPHIAAVLRELDVLA
jgi:hypothetical protein